VITVGTEQLRQRLKTAVCPQSVVVFKVLFSQQETVISLKSTIPLVFFLTETLFVYHAYKSKHFLNIYL